MFSSNLSNLPLVKIGDIATLVKRPANTLEIQTIRSLGVRWYGKGAYIAEEKSSAELRADRFVVHADDLIYNDMWARKGSVAIVPSDLQGTVASAHFPTWQLDLTRVYPAFLSYYFQTPKFWSDCESISQGSTGRNAITKPLFRELLIPLPTIDVQHSIVTRINSLTSRIETSKGLRQDSVALAEVLVNSKARTIFSEMGTAPIELVKLVDKTREGIQTGPFGAQLNSDDFLESGHPIITIGNVQYNGLKLDDLKYVSKEKAEQLQRYTVQPGDILFARMGTVGRCCVVPDIAEGWLINYHIIRVSPDPSYIESRYLHWLIQASPDIEAYLESNIRGATRQGVNTKIVSGLPCRVPSLARQRQIVAYLDKLQSQVNVLKQLQTETANELDAFMPSILDRVFRGELESSRSVTLADAFNLSMRQRFLLGVLSASKADQQPIPIVNLMKNIFLVQEEGGFQISDRYDFVPHKFGPFAKSLYDDLEVLAAQGFLKNRNVLTKGTDKSGKKRSTAKRLTTLNKKRLEEIQAIVKTLPANLLIAIEDTVTKHAQLDQNSLMAYVYARYKPYREKAVRRDLVKRGEEIARKEGWE